MSCTWWSGGDRRSVGGITSLTLTTVEAAVASMVWVIRVTLCCVVEIYVLIMNTALLTGVINSVDIWRHRWELVSWIIENRLPLLLSLNSVINSMNYVVHLFHVLVALGFCAEFDSRLCNSHRPLYTPIEYSRCSFSSSSTHSPTFFPRQPTNRVSINPRLSVFAF